MNKVVVEYNNKAHVCTGHVLYCADTDRSIASFWHESDINNVVEAINNHDRLTQENKALLESVVELQNKITRLKWDELMDITSPAELKLINEQIYLIMRHSDCCRSEAIKTYLQSIDKIKGGE